MSEKGRLAGTRLVSGVVGMAFQNGKGTVDLLEKNDAGEFVGQGHFPQRKDGSGGFAGFVGETICGADG